MATPTQQNTPTATPKIAENAAVEKAAESGVRQYFLSEASGELKPCLLAIAEVRYLSRSPSVDTSRVISALVDDPRETGQKWEDFVSELDEKTLSDSAPARAKLANLPGFMEKSSWWSTQEKEFEHWIYETDTVSVRVSKALDFNAGPEVNEVEFLKQAQAAAAERAQAEIRKLETSSKSKQTTLKGRIERAQAKVDKLEKEATSRNIDTALKVGETLLKFASKKKLTGVSTSATKFRMSSEAKGRLEEAKTVLEGLQEDLKELEQTLEDEKQAVTDKWQAEVDNIDEIKLTPTKQNIRITHFGIGWKS